MLAPSSGNFLIYKTICQVTSATKKTGFYFLVALNLVTSYSSLVLGFGGVHLWKMWGL